MADSKAFLKVADRLQKEKDVKAVVVSAGGKTAEFKKVTDILLDSAKKIRAGENVILSLAPFFERVKSDAESVGLYEKIKDELMIIEQEVEKGFLFDFLLSRGEYIYAKLFAYYYGLRFVDSKDIIKFYDDGRVNFGFSEYKIKEEYETNGCFITGGFYGSYSNGKIKTFSRGGSDFSGSIVAKSLNATEYLNFTDVDGIYTFNPNESKRVEIIKEINFQTVRLLGEFGASVLHPASVLPLHGTDTKILIKNTFNENAKGTVIFEKSSEKPYAVAKKDCNFLRVKARNNSYRLLKEIVKQETTIIFSNCSADCIELCLIGEIDENKIEKLIDVEYFKNIEETVVFYFSPCNKSQEVTIKIEDQINQMLGKRLINKAQNQHQKRKLQN